MSTARIDGTQLWYEDTGVGDAPFLLFNGNWATTESWGELVDLLAARRRVVRLDYRGTGRSTAADGQPTLETLAADARALLDALDIERAIGLAHARFIATLPAGGPTGRIFWNSEDEHIYRGFNG